MLNRADIKSWEYIDAPVVYDLGIKDNHNYHICCGDKRILVHNSGKSYAIMQVLITVALANPGYRITICTDTIPNLKKDIMRIMAEIVSMNPNVKRFVATYNSTDRIYTFLNGAFIEFNSYETREDAKGGKRDVVYINEATRLGYDVFSELYLRTLHKVFIDFNPTVRFWVHDRILGTPDEYKSVKVIRSWHVHNPYLSQEMHDRIENIKDPELWKVYARGLLGKLTGLVFSWGRVSEWPKSAVKEVIWGIDWGYTTDPTAITRVACMEDGSYVVDLVFYAPMTAIMPDKDNFQKVAKVDYLVYVLKQAGWHGNPIYADHDKELILSFRKMGVMVMPAEKGTGAELNRILYCKQKEISYTINSRELESELQRYRFVEVDGRNTNKIAPGNDHAIDSAVMAIYSHRNRMKK